MLSISWVGRLMVDAHIPLPAGLVPADGFGTALEHECTCHRAVWLGIDRFANTI